MCLPNNVFMHANKHGHLPIPSLSPMSTSTHIFKDLRSPSLVSIGQICDDDCIAIFSKKNLKIYNKQGNVILTGLRNHHGGLWDINFNTPRPLPPPVYDKKAFVILHVDKSKTDLAAYLRGCCFSPKKSTLYEAVKKNFSRHGRE